ncbi:MAG: tetratricopeptide repeat protein [Longimicrobiales bacterium]
MAARYQDDIGKLEALYAENPEGRVFTHLAEAYRKAGELERAREVLEAGLRSHEEYASAHVVLGRVRADQGDHEGAEASFRRVVELDPQNLVALRALGDLAREAGRDADAVERYKEVLAIDPSDEEIRAYVEGQQHPDSASPPETAAAETEAAAGTADVDVSTEPAPSRELDASAASAPGPESADPFDLGAVDLDSPGTSEARSTPPSEAGPVAEEPAGGEPAGDFEDILAPAEASVADASPVDVSPADVSPADVSPADVSPADVSPTEALTEEVAADVPVSDAPSGADDLAAVDLSGGEGFDHVTELADFGSSDLTFEDEPEGATAAPDEPEAMTPPSAAPDEPELVTETMGDLYIRQGFNLRAVDVYRRLLEQRPGDSRLEVKLAEAEFKVRELGEVSEPGREVAGGVEPGREPTGGVEGLEVAEFTGFGEVAGPTAYDDVVERTDLYDEPGAESGEAPVEEVEAVWTGRGGATGGEASPYGWEEEEAPGDVGAAGGHGPPIREQLASLLAWQPSQPPPEEGMSAASVDVGDEAADVARPAPDRDDDLDMFRAWLQSLKH